MDDAQTLLDARDAGNFPGVWSHARACGIDPFMRGQMRNEHTAPGRVGI